MDKIQREYPRLIPIPNLKVYEEKELIGYLIDISENGIMIISSMPISEGKTYSLTLAFDKKAHGAARTFNFSAQCKWSKMEYTDKEYYISGFLVTKISETHRLEMMSIINASLV